MIKHFIVMASAYSRGERIALDYFDDDVLQMDVIQKDIDFIFEQYGPDAPISTHFIQTESAGWDKVGKMDKFFAKAKLIKTKEEFVDILLKDKVLKGLDIAKYILTQVSCTHLKLEKLAYMCYADYLCTYKTKLFDDKIYAYKLGPVIESIYEKYKKSGFGRLYPEVYAEDDKKNYDEFAKKMPIRSRILSSEDGLRKLISIDKTLAKYKDLSADELVKLTHRENTPWTYSGAGEKFYEVITDSLIMEYHKFETI